MKFRHGDYWVEYNLAGDPIDESAEPVSEEILQVERQAKKVDSDEIALIVWTRDLQTAHAKLTLKNPSYRRVDVME